MPDPRPTVPEPSPPIATDGSDSRSSDGTEARQRQNVPKTIGREGAYPHDDDWFRR